MKTVKPHEAPVNAGKTPGLDPEKMKSFADKLGFEVMDILPLIQTAGLAAVLGEIEAGGEFTVPLKFCVVPSGKLPVFLGERTVRYMRECCTLADVDPDHWLDEYVSTSLEDSLGGTHDVGFCGIGEDLVHHHGPVEQGGEFTPEQKEALCEKLRETAFRFQQEVKAEQEAGASVEGRDA